MEEATKLGSIKPTRIGQTGHGKTYLGNANIRNPGVEYSYILNYERSIWHRKQTGIKRHGVAVVRQATVR